MSTSRGQLHDEEYYRTHCGPVPYDRNAHWLEAFSRIADEIINSFRPQRVFDAGCAMGLLVECLRDRGVDAAGADVSEFAIGKSRPDIRPYCYLQSLVDPIPGGHYDLITCIEVLEHLHAEELKPAVRNLTQATEAILFSSTPSDFNEPTHYTVRQPIFWLRLFAEFGFYPDLVYNASFLTPHAFVVRKREPMMDDVLLSFSEVLRTRGDRVAYLSRHNRIEELEREVADLRSKEAAHESVESQRAAEQETGALEDQTGSNWLAQITALVREEFEQDRAQQQVLLESLSGTRAEMVEIRQKLRGLSEEGLTQRVLELFETLIQNERANAAQLETARSEVESLRHELTSQTETRGQQQAELQRLTEHCARLRSLAEEGAAAQAEAQKQIAALEHQLSYLQSQRLVAESTTNQQQQAELQRLAEHCVRLRSLAEERAAAQAEAQKQIEALEYQLSYSQSQRLVAESTTNHWKNHCDQLAAAHDRLLQQAHFLSAELQAISQSPGWQLIQRYRNWLREQRLRRPKFFALWEGMAARLVGSRTPAPSGAPYSAPVASAAAVQGVPAAVKLATQSGPVPPPSFPMTASVGFPTTSPALPPRAAPAAESFEAKYGHPPPATIEEFHAWIAGNEPSPMDLEAQKIIGRQFTLMPKISVILPVYKVAADVLRDTIESVVAQTYANWELCVAMGAKERDDLTALIHSYSVSDNRIRYRVLDANEGISGNSNKALELATGEYIALLDHDDTLAPFALYEVVQLINEDPAVDFIYSDKDCTTEDGTLRRYPLMKPEWCPDMMLNVNYVTHFNIMRTESVRAIDGWRKETDGAQDWDLFLRYTNRFPKVRHIPKILYHWRQVETSVSSGGVAVKPYVPEGQLRTIRTHLEAIGLPDADVKFQGNWMRVLWPMRFRSASVILVGANDQATLASAARLKSATDFEHWEMVAPLTAGAEGADGVRVVAVRRDSGVLERIEAAVRSCDSEVVILCDAELTPASADWLSEVIGPLSIPQVVAVSARLIDAGTGFVRSCGLAFMPDGRVEAVYQGWPEHVSEQCGGIDWYRNWIAASGGCMAIRKTEWDQVKGFEGPPLHRRADIHLCLKLQAQLGGRVVVTPYARMRQGATALLESTIVPGAENTADRQFMPFAQTDRHFHPSLDCNNGRVIFRMRPPSADVVQDTNFRTEALELVQLYDFAPATAKRSIESSRKKGAGRLETITWFLSEFESPFYGGVHTLLRFADTFARNFGVKSHFAVFGSASPARLRSRIGQAFPELATTSEVFTLSSRESVHSLPKTDAGVCSFWTTAYGLLESERVRQKFYFIQDDETLFYPAGSTAALVDATFRFGFHGICNTPGLLTHYRNRGGDGEFFSPCVDPAVFHSNGRIPHGRRPPYRVFAYVRPNHLRNCFEMLAASLRLVKQRLRSKVSFFTAGAGWDPNAYGLGDVVHNLGMMRYRTTGALYRACDAGLVMMKTRHPSYLPMELMGCGSLVVTNYNPDTAWFLEDGQNALLAELSVTSLADRLEQALTDDDLRRRVAEQGKEFINRKYGRWDDEISKIHGYMRSKC